MNDETIGWWACGVMTALCTLGALQLLDVTVPDWAIPVGFGYLATLFMCAPVMIEKGTRRRREP